MIHHAVLVSSYIYLCVCVICTWDDNPHGLLGTLVGLLLDVGCMYVVYGIFMEAW